MYLTLKKNYMTLLFNYIFEFIDIILWQQLHHEILTI